MTLLERMARPDALPVMARVYLVALGTPRLAIDEATLAHMGALYDGAEPVTAADASALSILRDPLAVLREEQAPVTTCCVTGCNTDGAKHGEECGLYVAPPTRKPTARQMAAIVALIADAPPPCATCGGETWVGEPGQRVNCPDCARGAR